MCCCNTDNRTMNGTKKENAVQSGKSRADSWKYLIKLIKYQLLVPDRQEIRAKYPNSQPPCKAESLAGGLQVKSTGPQVTVQSKE